MNMEHVEDPEMGEPGITTVSLSVDSTQRTLRNSGLDRGGSTYETNMQRTPTHTSVRVGELWTSLG